MQEEGLINETRYHLLLLHKQVHDGGGGIEESLHACINRARLTACEVGIFSITKYLPNCWTLKVKIKHLAQELL